MCINHGIKIIPKEVKKKKRRSSFTLISVYAIYFYSFGTNLEGEAKGARRRWEEEEEG